MIKTKIEEYLRLQLAPEYCEVVDESYKHAGHAGAREGGHYRVVIVSRHFENKSLLERHRLVYEVVKPIKSAIHALSIKAKTPQEYQQH
jgi:BolA protein